MFFLLVPLICWNLSKFSFLPRPLGCLLVCASILVIWPGRSFMLKWECYTSRFSGSDVWVRNGEEGLWNTADLNFCFSPNGSWVHCSDFKLDRCEIPDTGTNQSTQEVFWKMTWVGFIILLLYDDYWSSAPCPPNNNVGQQRKKQELFPTQQIQNEICFSSY